MFTTLADVAALCQAFGDWGPFHVADAHQLKAAVGGTKVLCAATDSEASTFSRQDMDERIEMVR